MSDRYDMDVVNEMNTGVNGWPEPEPEEDDISETPVIVARQLNVIRKCTVDSRDEGVSLMQAFRDRGVL